MRVDHKSFRGSFLLYRRKGDTVRHPGKTAEPGGRPPRFRHATYEAAQAEATRLLAQYPESTFLILQEVGRVKAPNPDAREAA